MQFVPGMPDYSLHTHSSLNRPDPMSTQPLQPYEVHPKENFISRMRPEIAQMVRRSCVTWNTFPLADILQQAEHAEDGLHRQEEQKKQQTKETGRGLAGNVQRVCKYNPKTCPRPTREWQRSRQRLWQRQIKLDSWKVRSKCVPAMGKYSTFL